jgi:hypothetical protein
MWICTSQDRLRRGQFAVPLRKNHPSSWRAWLQRGLKTRTPPIGGVLSNSGLTRALAGLLSRLLRLLLPRILAGLLTLLIRLALAATLLRLAFVVLTHSNSPKVAEISFERASLKQWPYMEMNRDKHRGRCSRSKIKIRLNWFRPNKSGHRWGFA